MTVEFTVIGTFFCCVNKQSELTDVEMTPPFLISHLSAVGMPCVTHLPI